MSRAAVPAIVLLWAMLVVSGVGALLTYVVLSYAAALLDAAARQYRRGR